MEQKKKMSVENRGMNHCVIVVYTVFYVALFFQFLFRQWSFVYMVMDVGFMIGSIGMHIFRLGKESVRAAATVFFAHFLLALVCLNTSLSQVIVVLMITITVTVALYGMAWIMVIPIGIETICFSIYGSRLFSQGVIDMDAFWTFFYPVIFVYVIDYVLFVWLKNDNETKGNLVNTIHKLNRMERSKRDLLLRMGKEVYNPIQGAYEICEKMKEEEDLSYIKNHLQYIQASQSWMIGNLWDMMDYAALYVGSVVLENKPYETKMMVEDMVNISMAMRGTKDIEMVFDVDASLPSMLRGDRGRILRIVESVISNAIKYTQKGGVYCSVTQSRDVSGVSLLITVTDTGCGISPGFLTRLQEAFAQFDTEYLTNYKGMGIGLLMSHSLLSVMGGSMGIQSDLEQGTTVTLIVPQQIVEETTLSCRYEKKMLVFLEKDENRNGKILEGYKNMFFHMARQWQTEICFCDSLSHFQNRLHQKDFQNILISSKEYREHTSYFERLAEWHQVVVVSAFYERITHNPNIKLAITPFWWKSLMEAFESEKKVEKNEKKELSRSVLVVDDNEMNRSVMEVLLEPYPLQVTLAEGGQQAVFCAEKHKFDLIFMDIMMPQMDGITAMQKIRDIQRNEKECAEKKTIIVALSGNNNEGIREELILKGFDEFVAKPLDRTKLNHILEKFFPDKDKMLSFEERQQVKKKDIDGLDSELGRTYCGGEEAYEQILRDYAKKGEKNWVGLQQAFENRDWDNYTIEVHGIKSTLLTIGAKEISEKAKKLEEAGKQKDTTYIFKQHESLLNLYEQLICRLQERYLSSDEQTVERITDKQEPAVEIDTKDLQIFLEEIEEAAYLLDGKKMTDGIEQLQDKAYCGKPLRSVCEECLRKIQKEDFLSAWNMLEKACMK